MTDGMSQAVHIMMEIEERIRQADLAMESAPVSLEGLTTVEIDLANKLCMHFELPLGTLLRRSAAIKLIGEAESATDRLRKAAQHIIYE